MRPAGGPWATRRRPTGHRRASELRIMRAAFVCPTLRGPLPLLGNGLGLGHGHGHEHGWLAGWLGSYPAAVSRAPTTPRRSGAKKKVQCINPFLPVVLSRKGNPPPALVPPTRWRRHLLFQSTGVCVSPHITVPSRRAVRNVCAVW